MHVLSSGHSTNYPTLSLSCIWINQKWAYFCCGFCRRNITHETKIFWLHRHQHRSSTIQRAVQRLQSIHVLEWLWNKTETVLEVVSQTHTRNEWKISALVARSHGRRWSSSSTEHTGKRKHWAQQIKHTGPSLIPSWTTTKERIESFAFRFFHFSSLLSCLGPSWCTRVHYLHYRACLLCFGFTCLHAALCAYVCVCLT